MEIKKVDDNSPTTPDSLHFDFNKKVARGRFTFHIFQDHDHMVAFLPSLNLTAYGDNGNEAGNRLLKEVLNDYMQALTLAGPEVANKELSKLGWKRNILFKKRFVSDAYVDKDGILKNFNLPEETPIDTRTVSV